eukprot:tig00001001_g6203.t1
MAQLGPSHLSAEDFIIQQEIFRSRAGIVYRAKAVRTGKLVVLKQRNASELGKHKDILHEVNLLSQLDHPNIVRFTGYFFDRSSWGSHLGAPRPGAGSLYIGETLPRASLRPGALLTEPARPPPQSWSTAREATSTRCCRRAAPAAPPPAHAADAPQRRRARREPLSEDEIWGIFLQICNAVEYIHSKRIIHRDLKSLNVFLTADGVVKVGDFGVGREKERDAQLVTSFYGTPLYLSPEQVDNKPYNEKVDVWSLGVILYELAALETPFQAPALGDLVNKIRAGAYRPLPNSYSTIMQDAVDMLLQAEPNRRPAVGDFVAWLRDARRGRNGRAAERSPAAAGAERGRVRAVPLRGGPAVAAEEPPRRSMEDRAAGARRAAPAAEAPRERERDRERDRGAARAPPPPPPQDDEYYDDNEDGGGGGERAGAPSPPRGHGRGGGFWDEPPAAGVHRRRHVETPPEPAAPLVRRAWDAPPEPSRVRVVKAGRPPLEPAPQERGGYDGGYREEPRGGRGRDERDARAPAAAERQREPAHGDGYGYEEDDRGYDEPAPAPANERERRWQEKREQRRAGAAAAPPPPQPAPRRAGRAAGRGTGPSAPGGSRPAPEPGARGAAGASRGAPTPPFAVDEDPEPVPQRAGGRARPRPAAEPVERGPMVGVDGIAKDVAHYRRAYEEVRAAGARGGQPQEDQHQRGASPHRGFVPAAGANPPKPRRFNIITHSRQY